MAKKKHGNVAVTQAEREQAQQLASRYHAIARALHSSKNQQQAEKAIQDINQLSEASQLALLKQLAKEINTDAADVLSAVNQFILNNPDIENATDLDDELELDEDDDDFDNEDEYDEIDESLFTEDHAPENITASFVELWLDGKFELVYGLLTEDSSIREGLPQEEWIERRQAWFDQMHPDRFMPYYARPMEPQKSSLWLPNPFKDNRQSDTKQCEASWSVELSSSPLQASLPELPEATCVCQDTGRQWFCATFTLAREQDRWRIQHITDRGRELLLMPAAEFDKQFTDNEKRTKDITSKHKPSDPDATNYLPGVLTLTLRTFTFVDILYKRRPLVEREELEQGPVVTEMLGEYERAFAYLDQLQQIFPEKRAEYLQMQATDMMELGESVFEHDKERAQHFFAIAIEKMRESLTLHDEAENRLSLSQMIVRSNGDLDEAAALVHSASTEITDPQRQSVVENELGNIAYKRQNYPVALEHFQRSLELDPVPAIQDLNMAHVHAKLGNNDEAITYYEQALQKEPANEDAYLALSRLYTEQGHPEEAIRTMENAVRNNPDSLEMRLELATICMDTGNYNQAEKVMQEIGREVPETETIIQEMIQTIRQRKKNAGRSGLPSPNSSRIVNAPTKFSSKKKKK